MDLKILDWSSNTDESLDDLLGSLDLLDVWLDDGDVLDDSSHGDLGLDLGHLGCDLGVSADWSQNLLLADVWLLRGGGLLKDDGGNLGDLDGGSGSEFGVGDDLGVIGLGDFFWGGNWGGCGLNGGDNLDWGGL